MEDLKQVRFLQQTKIKDFLSRENVSVSIKAEFEQEFMKSFHKISPNDKLEINKNDSKLLTGGQGKYISFPNSWYYLAFLAAPYFSALEIYRDYAFQKFKEVAVEDSNVRQYFQSIGLSEKSNEAFRHFIEKSKNNDPSIKMILDLVSRENSNKIPEIEEFLTDYNSWGGGKTVDRADYYISPVLALLELINQSSTYIADLTKIIAKSDIDLEKEELYFEFFENSTVTIPNKSILQAIPNCIYYGAPGTGKSYSVSERIKEVYPKFNELNSDESKFVFRTTLHPEYTYSDFVGQLMPVKNNDSITYEFTPGIFTLALKQAITNPDHYVFLVLEELSRANVASVFGDLFQLLDRAEGVSEYSISNPLIANFVYHDQSNNQTSTISNSYIYLPSNFVLLGTVNTNDQNVFVMDTAFKRRFEWEYVSTDAVGDNVNNPSIEYQKDKFISWWDFYKEINRYITVKMKLGEDKQIGQFFIKFSEDNSRNKKLIQNKLLQYLWEDVEKASYGKKLFSEKINSFSDLYKNYEEGLQIFSDEFINRIELSITHLDNADLMVAENNIGDISYDQRDK